MFLPFSPAPKPKRKFIYLPDGWDDTWRSAKSSSGSTPANFIQIGDSIGQGFNSTDNMNTNYWSLVRANLLNTYTLGADFWGVQMSPQFNSQVAGSVPWAFTNATFTASLGSKNYWMYNTGVVAGIFATFVTPYACTAIDIHYQDFVSAQSFDIYVDGVFNQTITCAATKNDLKISISSLSNTTHTITFRNCTGATACVLLGIVTYSNTSSGIRFANFAYSGAKTADWQTYQDTNGAYVGMALYQGYTPQTFHNAFTIPNNTGFGFPTQGHLVILELGVNDCQAGVSTTTYISNLVAFIQAIRRGQSNASIIIVAPANPDGVNSDVRSSLLFTNSKLWWEYLQQMLTVAIMFNCAFVNVHAKWGELGFSQGFQLQTSSFGPHPIDGGHADIAALINSII